MCIKTILAMKIATHKLGEMETEARMYSMFSDPVVKSGYRFRYKRITKILFAEYFI